MKTRLLSTWLIAAAAALAPIAARAQTLSPTGVTATPGSALPGTAISYSVAVSNSDTTQYGPGAADTATIKIVLTNLVTGYQFTVGPIAGVAPDGGFVAPATANPTTGVNTPGAGSFTLPPQTIPASVTQAGNYSADVTITALTGGSIGAPSFNVSSSVLTVTGAPDLEITNLTYSSGTSYVGGNVIPMSITFTNTVSTNGSDNVPWVPGVTPGPGGAPVRFRIMIVLSSNPTFGSADNFQLTFMDIDANALLKNAPLNMTSADAASSVLNADGVGHTITWQQLLPGNFAGSYYVLAMIDSLSQVTQNEPAPQTVNGNPVWGGNTLNPSGTLINLLPTTFPTTTLTTHATGVNTSDNGYSDNPSMSSDGRYVAFASDATNLVASDTSGARNVYIYDNETTLVRMLSMSQQGVQGNGASNNPVISGDGTNAAFASDANNLVFGDTNGFTDVFAVNTTTGLIARVSVSSSGGQANGSSFTPAISQTGRWVVFESTATNLIAAGTAVGVSHIYLHDRDVSNSGTFDTAGNISTTLVDVTSGGAGGNGNSIQPAISSDGSTVAFASLASNLGGAATTNGVQNVFVCKITNDATVSTTLVSVANGTATEGNGASQTPSLSSNGQYVAFASLASNLVAGDTNGVSDIFVYDTTQPVATPVVRCMSVSSSGVLGTDPSPAGFQLGSLNPTISATGRYVAYSSLDNNLTSGDVVGREQSTDGNNGINVYVHDRDVGATGTYDTAGNLLTQMVSVNSFGYQTYSLLGVPSTAASNIYPVLSSNGRFVAFPTDADGVGGLAFGATNLLPLDSNGTRDVFLFDRRTNTLPNPTQSPQVTITSPGNGSAVLVNTAIPITASATTTVGVVASVQFFVNNVSLGTSTDFPYTQTWTPTAVGTYTLSALVTDSFGNPGISSNVTVTVDAAPSIGITSPVAGTTITLGATQTVTAVASPTTPGATIVSVQFFVNGISLGTTTTSPYSEPWTPTSAGTYNLTAIATDSNGILTTSPTVTVTVSTTVGVGVPPVVAITSPTSGSTLTVGQPTSIVVNASSPNGTVTSVQFFANGTSLGTVSTFPYSFQWTPATPGTYVLKATATDNAGNQASSASVNVTVTSGSAPTVTLTSPTSGSAIPLGNGVQLVASATAAIGSIKQVQFFENNTLVPNGTVTTAPYSVNWIPGAAGTYTLTAVATDTVGNTGTSAPATFTVTSTAAPAVTITSPTSGSTYGIPGPAITFTVNAFTGAGQITQVQFFVNGILLGPALTKPPYTTTWAPTALGTYSLTAIATSSANLATVSAPVLVTINASQGPTVALTSPASGSSSIVGVPIQLSAGAGDSAGAITSVQFEANGFAVVPAITTPPYTATWVPTLAGTYSVIAVATDSFGNIADSAPATITVNPDELPAISITSPAAVSVVGINSGIVLTASASSPLGSVSSVQFYVNGVALGSPLTAAPYTTTFSPPSAGIYTITAVATDNVGNTTTSAAVTVAAEANGASTTEYAGTYQGSGDIGRFELVTVDGKYATFIAHSTSGITTPVFYDDLALNASGGFTASGISGTTSATGVSGTFNGGKTLFIGPITLQTGITVASGYYTGSLSGQPTSQVFAIVGSDGSVMIYISQGSFADAGDGAVDSTGAFGPITTAGNNTISGKVDPKTGFLTGTLTGGPGGTILAAKVSDGTFSDGVLRNLSTRGLTGTGGNVMIAGFVVGGSVPKQLLVRAIGPTLSQFSITGNLAATNLALENSAGTIIGLNQGWNNPVSGVDASQATAATMTAAGAFALPTGSGDSALVALLQPGAYTATMSGVGGASGVGLVELYDMDQLQAFSSQKLINVSTRGMVGTGQQILIGGLTFNGVAPKRLLIRAVGPTLSQFGVTNPLSTPVLRIYNSAGTLVRENTSWQVGNDPGLVTTAATQTGATPLQSGSADSVVLITLVPGSYTAQVTSAGSATGVALVEVYEVP